MVTISLYKFNDRIHSSYRNYIVGQFVQGKVEFHTPFGVFLDIDNSMVKGLIKIADFLDEGEMREDMYPEIGTTVGAVVVGYNESNCREVWYIFKRKA